jgi:hypothetical protein
MKKHKHTLKYYKELKAYEKDLNNYHTRLKTCEEIIGDTKPEDYNSLESTLVDSLHVTHNNLLRKIYRLNKLRRRIFNSKGCVK